MAVASPGLQCTCLSSGVVGRSREIRLDSQCSVIGRLCHVCFLLPAPAACSCWSSRWSGEQAKAQGPEGEAQAAEAVRGRAQATGGGPLQNSDEDSGDWVLLNVYDSIQEEVRAKSKLLEKMQRKVRPGPGPAPRQARPAGPALTGS